MPWNPDIYNQFKDIRYRPFFDLMNLIDDKNLHKAIDVGCGTGEQTKILSDNFLHTQFLGIDASTEMLAPSKDWEYNRVQFENKTIENFVSDNSRWDLIFSNAALQWIDNHQSLFPQLIAKLNAGGQLAVQMPCQHENILNFLLKELVSQKPFAEYLNNFRRESPMLSVDKYTQIMFENGLQNLNISQRVYPIIAQNEMDLYNFILGSSLIPYLERLNKTQQDELKNEFLQSIKSYFKKFPAIYPFKRLLLYGVKP